MAFHSRRLGMPGQAGQGGDGADTDDAVPVFGTWRRIYACVVLSAVAVMALIALFSAWPY
jgi:hypothetical protein